MFQLQQIETNKSFHSIDESKQPPTAPTQQQLQFTRNNDGFYQMDLAFNTTTNDQNPSKIQQLRNM